jgi:small subunit ribosomal protein S15
MITHEKKQAAIAGVQTHASDTGSAAAQIAIATERIKELTEHLKVHNKDFAARRGLLQLVGRRRRLLAYVANSDSNMYLGLIQKLGIRR